MQALEIWLVDDEPHWTFDLENALTEQSKIAGHEALTIRTFSSGSAMFNAYNLNTGRPQVVVIDANMGDEKGEVYAEYLQQREDSVHFVVFSGEDPTTLRQRFSKINNKTQLLKHTSIEATCETIFSLAIQTEKLRSARDEIEALNSTPKQLCNQLLMRYFNLSLRESTQIVRGLAGNKELFEKIAKFDGSKLSGVDAYYEFLAITNEIFRACDNQILRNKIKKT